jgi:hypothetical protein
MELRRRFIVLTSVVGFGCVAGCSSATSPSTTSTSPTNPVTASAFVGLWQNVDANTLDNPQLQIRVDGSTIYVRGYEACGPTFCDWGEAPAPAANAATGTFTVNWIRLAGTNSAISYKMTLMLATGDGLLRTASAVHFSNGQQPDRVDLQSFQKGS